MNLLPKFMRTSVKADASQAPVKKKVPVEVGQVYLDNDPRVSRRVRVVKLLEVNDKFYALVENVETLRKSRVWLRNLEKTNHRGYTLVGMSK